MVEPVGDTKQVQVPRKELEAWLVQRAKGIGIELTPPAARALLQTLGEDLAQLAGALDQLGAAFEARRITPAEVHKQFRGLGEQKTWDLCDRAFGKDLPGAIRALRAIEESGDEALMVLGGIAVRVRDLIRVRALPDRTPPAQVAKQAGLRFDWQARRYQQQARNYSLDELVTIHDRYRRDRPRAEVGRAGRRRDAGVDRGDRRVARPSPRSRLWPGGSSCARPSSCAGCRGSPPCPARARPRAATWSRSASPAAAAAWTFLVEVFRALLVAMLRWWRFSFWMLRFFWDLMFAMTSRSLPAASVLR